MKEYLLTLVAAALIAALIGILSPDGERGGIAKHLKLLTSLFLICVLISPLHSVLTGLKDLANGNLSLPNFGTDTEDDYRQQMDEALDGATESYFSDMLTQTLESQFSIATGDVACRVEWVREGETHKPLRVTVILSGKAIWKDPKPIEDFVSELLGCECRTAIE